MNFQISDWHDPPEICAEFLLVYFFRGFLGVTDTDPCHLCHVTWERVTRYWHRLVWTISNS